MSQKARFLIWMLLAVLILIFTLSPIAAQQEKTPVAADGPYGIGVQIRKFTDESRDNRELEAYIWYPASTPKGAKPPYAPDTTGAPYPLVIYSHGYGSNPTEASGVFINHLVSQGFIVAGVDHQDTDELELALVNRPLDVLFLLNQLADLSEDDPLTGVINTDDVGVIGYSAGSYTSIVAGGAGIDSPGTDERIKAIGLIAPCFADHIGKKGIAAVDLPTILFAGTKDTLCPAEVVADYYYQNLTAPDRYLVTLTGRDHGTTMQRQVLESYVSAFFGLYLQDKTDYAQYLTPDSAAAFRSITLESQLAESS